MSEMYKNKDDKVVVYPGRKGGHASGPDYQVGGIAAKGFAAATPEQRKKWGKKGGKVKKND